MVILRILPRPQALPYVQYASCLDDIKIRISVFSLIVKIGSLRRELGKNRPEWHERRLVLSLQSLIALTLFSFSQRLGLHAGSIIGRLVV